MATSKLLADILAEMKKLRNDINRVGHINNRSRPLQRSTSSSTQGSAQKPTSARKLLTTIANRTSPLGNCWYHKTHGIATNPRNCPGPTACSWNQEEEVEKMKKLVQRVKRTSTPAQDRIALARSNYTENTIPAAVKPKKPATITSPVSTMPVFTEPIPVAPILPMPTPTPIVTSQPAALSPTMDWNNEVDDPYDDLANLSDTD